MDQESLKHICMPPTRPLADAITTEDNYCDDSEEEEVEAWSDEEFEVPVALEYIFACIAARETDGPLRPEITELIVALMLAYADDLRSMFEQRGPVKCVESAIELQIQAISLTPNGHGKRASRLSKLGHSLSLRFERLGDPADALKSIDYWTQAMQITPDGDSSIPVLLDNLGVSYSELFQRLGNLADVEKAIECQTQAVRLTPVGHASKPSFYANLGNSYQCRFRRLGVPIDVVKAIACHTQAVRLTPDSHANKPGWLSSLGNSWLCLFESFGEPNDVEKAIEYQTQAVLLTPDGHVGKPGLLNNLGNSYSCRFRRLGEPADADKAIEYHTLAMLLTPDDSVGKPALFSNLGTSYIRRFERFGELADVDKAIECQTKGMRLAPDDHADRPNWLTNLGNSYGCRFESLGQLEDIDKAIECHTQAFLLTPQNDASKPNRLNNLGCSYGRRFLRLREPVDVDTAVECLTRAVLLTPDGHAGKPGSLINLGNSYRRRFECLGQIEDVNKAIEFYTQAVQLTPDGHPDKPSWLSNLGGSYGYRFQHLDELADAEQAIRYLTQGVLLTLISDPYKPVWLGSLGSVYRWRFERLGKLSDVDKAIECHNLAVRLTPEGHASKPHCFYNRGCSYMRRYEYLGQPSDLAFARSSFQGAAEHIVTDPYKQIWCACEWAKCCSSLDISPLPAYARCMELIPLFIWLGDTVDKRYSQLPTITDFVADAAACAISAQAYDLAIEWLEQGRSVVWSQILQLRTPVDDLFTVNHALAERLQLISAELEGAGTRSLNIALSNDALGLEMDDQRHRRLAEAWEKSLAEARNIPGFEDFMRPRRAEELKRAATDGPIVLISTCSTRCDALIIFPECDDIAHLPLTNLSLDKAVQLHAQLNSSLRHRGDTTRWIRLNAHHPDDTLRTMLVDMWTTIVAPVLGLICSRDTTANELPHVTWCATGALSFLPLHAAGPYDGSSPNALDLVVSSYTPTLDALLNSNPSISKPGAGLLVVGQESTPLLPSLPFTVQELEAIQKHAKQIQYLRLDSHQANVNAVLRGMDEHSWVHLACHASQDQDNPAQSGFYLCDGNLTLETITKRQFKDKGLAFLSACQTATGDGKLPDEAVHLAAGMLMAGYPSVIATMWPMCDLDGPKVADRVYAELLKDGKMNHRGAARALHKAVVGLRESLGGDPSERWRWVPFIHIGV